jgi:hypothetical protein
MQTDSQRNWMPWLAKSASCERIACHSVGKLRSDYLRKGVREWRKEGNVNVKLIMGKRLEFCSISEQCRTAFVFFRWAQLLDVKTMGRL